MFTIVKTTIGRLRNYQAVHISYGNSFRVMFFLGFKVLFRAEKVSAFLVQLKANYQDNEEEILRTSQMQETKID